MQLVISRKKVLMKQNKDFIESGILEQYVLGNTTPEETREVERRALEDAEIRNEIESISTALEQYAFANAMKPSETIKPFVMATIDYTKRLMNGEQISFPPVLNEESTIDDYLPWISREDMKREEGDLNIFAKIIGYTPEMTTAIVWLKDYSPPEVHDDELERFLIVEGSCEITVENETRKYNPSDYFAVPLHKTHSVKVTSLIPCKIILQRIAA